MAEAKPSSRSLAEFAAAEKDDHLARCAICRSPHRAEIEAARERGVPYGVISRWLRSEHPEQATVESTVGNHFRNGHHVKR